jgi:hypothetical protein
MDFELAAPDGVREAGEEEPDVGAVLEHWTPGEAPVHHMVPGAG